MFQTLKLRRSQSLRGALIGFILGSAVFCPTPPPAILGKAIAARSEASQRPQIKLSEDVVLEKIGDGVWRHITTDTVEGFGLVASNGLVIQSGREAFLVDTAWNDAQTKLILDWIEKELKASTSYAVFTHYHRDRQGGIHEIHRRGIKSLSSKLTVEQAKKHGLETAKEGFDREYNLKLGDRAIRIWYAGPGHTPDNVIVWIPDQKILFGGCLIKDAHAESLGNTADADLAEWPLTVQKIQRELGQAVLVVPGHGDTSGTEALTRTLELLKQAGSKP